MLAIINGHVLTITRGELNPGVVLIEGKKIKAVGRDLPIPPEAEVIDASGWYVMPGMIDAHSHLGVLGEPWIWSHDDVNELVDPVTPHLRAIDSLNPDDVAIQEVVAAGITTVYTGPGSGNVVGGTGIAIKLRGATADEMVIPNTEGMKMALGENPKRVYGRDQKKAPATRMGNAGLIRESLVKAENYLQKKPEGERDIRLEALSKVLTRELKARIHAHRADDILTALRIGEEFNLDVVIEHATEGYKVAEILAEKQVPCVVGPLLMGRSKAELQEVNIRNAAILAQAGVKIAIQVDATSETRWLPIEVGVAIREGLPEEEAFRAVTINPAAIIGVEDRLGSIEPGKDADLALFDGHPFETRSRCRMVLIDGEVVHRYLSDR
ncbi:MAG: amidohydrolase [Limnochordia bacterium]|jgi:imidazolonepropionase-like amidohydrolase|nr:amidohydrolase [Bacillota bacterium]